MTVAYFGKNTGTFFEDDPANIKNGGMATSSLFSKIANNQTWLAVQDVEACNFLTDTYGLSPTSEELTVQVLLSPFSRYVDFWFLAMRDGDDLAANAFEFIEISCATDTQRTTAIPAGANSTGKTHGGSVREARWVVFGGTLGDGTANSGLALKCRANPDPTWVQVPVTIKVSSSKVKIFSGALHVQPPRGALTVST